jgi:hypothetical protein
MTYLDKVKQESPEDIGVNGIPVYCPPNREAPVYCGNDFFGDAYQRCTKCWNTEIPEEKEKENKPMKKTKAMLEEELEQKRTEIEDLKKELENEIKKTEKYKQFEECADDLKALQNSFINSGFSEKQAFTMVLQIIGSARPRN